MILYFLHSVWMKNQNWACGFVTFCSWFKNKHDPGMTQLSMIKMVKWLQSWTYEIILEVSAFFFSENTFEALLVKTSAFKTVLFKMNIFSMIQFYALVAQ